MLGGRFVRFVVAAALLLGFGLYFVPPTQAGQGAWVNHDADNWNGWSDPANPGFAANPQGCDPIVPQQCMLPYPDDWLTGYDHSSLTTRKLNLNPLAMPRNAEGRPIDPSAWNNWSDGFSAGTPILTFLPGVTKNSDLVASGIPTDTSIATNFSTGEGVILLDADTGQVWPVWAEVDQYTAEAGVLPAGAVGSVQQDVMIHPASNLVDGHRYIVALRNVHDDNGTIVSPSAAFKAYRDGPPSASDPRTAHMHGIFDDLAEAGWNQRHDLLIAWDFTTASTQSATGRLVSMRDDALGQLGETKADMGAGAVTAGSKAPAFTVTSVTDYTPSQSQHVAREITGTFTVPCYIAPSCSPPVKCETLTAPTPIGTVFDDCPSPGEFALDPTNLYATPGQIPGQTYQADFICIVGRTGWGSRLMRPVEYGHGLFGSASEVRSGPQQEMADRFGMMYCATDWFGFANADIPNAVLALSDLSNFPILIDRTVQGELNFLYLQRLMIHPDGFASDAAFRYSTGSTFIDTSGVYYDGNSQGGIYGGTVCAVSVDVKHCSLGVPGMDYSTLLPRSSDYVATSPLGPSTLLSITPSNPQGGLGYSNLFDLFYPDQSQRQLVLDLIQTLWDRADPNGYASHMTSTASGGLLPDTPDHRVLMQAAWGDHQVANVTAEDEARTIGAATFLPALDPSRFCGDNDAGGAYCYGSGDPTWGLPAITSTTYDGSAIVFFDAGPVGADEYGTEPPPPSDVPNLTGGDPHEAPRRSCAAQEQKSDFMASGGLVTQVVQANGQAQPYFSGGWQGTCTT